MTDPDGGGHWHARSAEDVLASLATSPAGLDDAEVGARRARHGGNLLPTAQGRPWWRRFLRQFHDVLIYVLISAAALTALMQHWVDAGVISGVVLINAVIGMIQEGKAEKAMDALRGMLTSTTVVRRGGAERTVAAEELVPGDIVLLKAGDKVPADLRLLEARDLRIEEAVLTGESAPVDKHTAPVPAEADLGDRACLAHSGTLVTAGRGVGVAFTTGAGTELGRINELLGSVKQLTTPLLAQMARFGRSLALIILGIAGAAFLYSWLVTRDLPLVHSFLAAVALAIAAIPEGLPAVMTIALAIGVRRMAARNAIIRQLAAVDTLGAVTVICSDKTGTLTRNEMTVTTLLTPERTVTVDGVGYVPEGAFASDGAGVDPASADLRGLLTAGLLCCEARLVEEAGRWRIEGPPTEGAVLVAARKAGLVREELLTALPPLDAVPFTSQTKIAARLHGDGSGARLVLLGAPDRLLARCTHERRAGSLVPIDAGAWRRRMDEHAARGLRMLGMAERHFDRRPDAIDQAWIERDLCLLGLVGIIDPPREEAVAAIRTCHEAGIRVMMITGDHALTARAIAGDLGIPADAVMVGAEIEAADEGTLRTRVREVSVFARVSPQHKLRLVGALQAEGQVVAMTGDGVNDAPAIKRADVGVAMGITGTEVSREASDMVLADDNFASIEHAVEEGRTVYDNLRKSILFILPTNGGEALTLLIAIAFAADLPLTPAQILWVNMVTAITLALALAFEPAEDDLMRRPPRRRDAALLDRYFVIRITYVSLLVGIGTFAAFHLGLRLGEDLAGAQTLAVNALVGFEIGYLISTRFITAPALSWRGLSGNRMLLGAAALVAALQVAYSHVPLLQTLFGSAGMPLSHWAGCAAAGVALLLMVEGEKAFTRRRAARAQAR